MGNGRYRHELDLDRQGDMLTLSNVAPDIGPITVERIAKKHYKVWVEGHENRLCHLTVETIPPVPSKAELQCDSGTERGVR